MFGDINDTLLRHLATASGAAYNLRANRPELLRAAGAFVSARGDVKRLDAAQQLASEILRKNDFGEMIDLRDIVARQELRRQIKYTRQQDHTAHTVYLYLLGVWLYDNLPDFQDRLARKHNINRSPILLGPSNPFVLTDTLDVEFLFQWVFASLLHDIGYVFYDLTSETVNDRQAINDLFSWKCVRANYGELSQKAENALRDAHSEWQRRYSNVHTLTSFAEDAFVEILQFLADAPWLGDLVQSVAGKDLLAVLELDQSTKLRTYAFEVASKGYLPTNDRATRCVDHAVASGLFLLRYVAFSYWLIAHVQANAPSALLHITSGCDYAVKNLKDSVIPACRAVAYHNIKSTVASGVEIIPLLTLDAEPLVFLSVLCDELQIWDRSPAGRTHLNDYRKYAKSALDGADIELVCTGPRSRAKALMRIRASSEVRKSFEYGLRETLDGRLPNWNQVIEIQVVNR